MDQEFIWRVPRTPEGLRDAVKMVEDSNQWPESALAGLSVFIPNRPNEPLVICFVVDGDDPVAGQVTPAPEAGAGVSWLDEVALERATDLTLDGLVAQIGTRYGMISGPTEVVLAGLQAYGRPPGG